MASLLGISRFDGFGGCALRPRATPKSQTIPLMAETRGIRKLLRSECPTQPGVYGMVSAEGELIYVGVSKSLRHRLLSYFHRQPDDAKARRIVEHSVELHWEPAPHELVALVREIELIRRWTPRFNVKSQPGRRRLGYVCLGRGPAAYAYLAPQPTSRAHDYFGPTPETHRMRQALSRVNDLFQLRDCSDRPMIFSDQLRLFSEDRAPQCLRHALGTCLGPCAGLCSSRDYARRVAAARAFLRGENRAPLDALERQMLAASAGCQFERAAALRDVWQDLAWVYEQFERLRAIRRDYCFVYPAVAGDKTRWHLIQRGRISAITDAARDATTARRFLRAWENVYADSQHDAESPAYLDHALVVAGWFRKRPTELAARIEPNDARRLAEGLL